MNRVSLRMPEHIEVSYELAGLGSRFVANLLDTFIVVVVVGVLAIGIGYLRNRFLPEFGEGWVAAVIIIASVVLLYIAYFVYFEVTAQGQSVGKRAAGLRVIAVDGSPISFEQSAIRNILRIFDAMPPFALAGVAAAFWTKRQQRLGDLAAGTMVVKERLREMPEAPTQPVPELPAEVSEEVLRAVRAGVRAVSRDEVETIRRFLERRFELSPEARGRLAAKLAGTIRRRFPGLPPEQLSNPEVFLEVVVHVIDEAD